MDDLILAGALSVTGLYAAAVLAVAVVVLTLMELYGAAVAGDLPGLGWSDAHHGAILLLARIKGEADADR